MKEVRIIDLVDDLLREANVYFKDACECQRISNKYNYDSPEYKEYNNGFYINMGKCQALRTLAMNYVEELKKGDE